MRQKKPLKIHKRLTTFPLLIQRVTGTITNYDDAPYQSVLATFFLHEVIIVLSLLQCLQLPVALVSSKDPENNRNQCQWNNMITYEKEPFKEAVSREDFWTDFSEDLWIQESSVCSSPLVPIPPIYMQLVD